MASLGSVSALQLGTLLKVVARMHGLPPSRLPALKARFSNFAKIRFPGLATVGTGTRAEYWPEHVAQLLVAFELLAFRIPQSAAASGVTNSRAEVLAAVGVAARHVAAQEGRASCKLSVLSNALLEDAKEPSLADISLVQQGVGETASEGDRRTTVMAIDCRLLVKRAALAGGLADEPFDVGFFSGLTAAS